MIKTPLSGVKIGVIGVGNMGQALVRGLVQKSAYPQNVSVYDIDQKKVDALRKDTRVKSAKTARQCVSLTDVVILAVKPKGVPEAVEEIRSVLEGQTLVISIAAGVPLVALEGYFKKPVCLIRVMPNMPALSGAGMSAFSLGRHATTKHRKIAEAILSSFGEAVMVPEKALDLVTAVSGSGPAYFFLLAEKMIEAAYELGMKVDTAKKLVYQTAFGSGKVLAESQEDPEDLIARVASKGGTTEAALKVFQKHGFGKIIHDGVKAALRRSKELKEGR